jgi:Major capsid protein Gp23
MADQTFLSEEVKNKWKPVIDHPDVAPIKESWKKKVTTILLENTAREIATAQRLNEDAPGNFVGAGMGATAGNIKGFDPILISLIRRSMPNLIAYDVCGVQPMTGPTGLIFALKSRYGSQTGNEALFYEANTEFSAASLGGTQAGDQPSVNNSTGTIANDSTYTYGTGMTTLQGEALGPQLTVNASGLISGNTVHNTYQSIPEMAFSIDKVTVTAKTRKLKAEYTIEIAQDLKAIHGLDAETELANILSAEILAEINREIVRTIYFGAVAGAQHNTASAGFFNLDTDSDGRWLAERFKGMFFQIEREANAIAKATRRGKGNIVICSSDVASALAAADILHYQSAYDANLTVDDMGSTFAGTLQGRYKVYVDPYAPSSAYHHFCVGFRGTSPYDAGLFYCPYVPLQMLRAQDPNSFQPKIGFQTRYGVVANPFSNAAGNSNGSIVSRTNEYYRLVAVKNLM